MSIERHNWYDTNSNRKYPISDLATGLDDQGLRLPSDVIADMQLRWPRELGEFAFIGGVTVTDTVTTVVILAADTVSTAATFRPLASVTIQSPSRHRMYSVTPLADGVAGFIVFGDTSEQVISRFSSPTQSLILPSLAQSYAALPVSSIRKHGRHDGLTDIVGIRPGSDVIVTHEQLTIDGMLRDAIVVSLQGPVDGQDVLEKYIGPCGVRPESGNCEQDGVQTINGVSPDCHGDLRIVFRGFTTGPFESCGAGVTLDQNVGIDAVCVTDKLAEVKAVDLCYESLTSSLSSESIPSDSTSDSSTSDDSVSSSSVACGSLPHTECFADDLTAGWTLKTGAYVFEDCTSSAGS